MGFELIPFGLLGLGAVLIVWGVRTFREAGRLPQHWLPVTGRVIDDSRPQRIEYRTPRGVRVELRVMLDSSYRIGQEVDVLVDPVDSSQARLVDADRAAASTGRTLLITGGVFMVAGALAAVAFA